MGMKQVVYLMMLLVATLVGCSTKKYLPKIFNPDMAKVNVKQTTLYYEKTGMGTPVIFIHKNLAIETQIDRIKITICTPCIHGLYTPESSESKSMPMAPLPPYAISTAPEH